MHKTYNGDNNLIIIPLLGSMIMSSSQPLQHNKSILYISEDLKDIRDNVYYAQHCSKLSGQTVIIIRSLRIRNKKKRKEDQKLVRKVKTQVSQYK